MAAAAALLNGVFRSLWPGVILILQWVRVEYREYHLTRQVEQGTVRYLRVHYYPSTQGREHPSLHPVLHQRCSHGIFAKPSVQQQPPSRSARHPRQPAGCQPCPTNPHNPGPPSIVNPATRHCYKYSATQQQRPTRAPFLHFVCLHISPPTAHTGLPSGPSPILRRPAVDASRVLRHDPTAHRPPNITLRACVLRLHRSDEIRLLLAPCRPGHASALHAGTESYLCRAATRTVPRHLRRAGL